MLPIFLTIVSAVVITTSLACMENNTLSKPVRIVSEGPLQRLRPAAMREKNIVLACANGFIAVAKNSEAAAEYLKNFARVNKFIHTTIKENREELKKTARYAQEHIYEKFATDDQLLTGDLSNPIIKKTASNLVKEQYSSLDSRALFFLPPDDMLNRVRLKKIQHLFDDNIHGSEDNLSDLISTLDWSVNAGHQSRLTYTLLGAFRRRAKNHVHNEELRARFIDIVKTSHKDPLNSYMTQSLLLVGQELYGDQLYTAQGHRSSSSIVDSYLEFHKETRTKEIVTQAINNAFNC